MLWWQRSCSQSTDIFGGGKGSIVRAKIYFVVARVLQLEQRYILWWQGSCSQSKDIFCGGKGSIVRAKIVHVANLREPEDASATTPHGKQALQHGVRLCHTPRFAFRHLPPTSARIGNATDGALYFCTDTVSALGKAWLLKDCGSNIASNHPRKHRHIRPELKNEFCLDSNDFGFICAGVSNVGGYIKKGEKKKKHLV